MSGWYLVPAWTLATIVPLRGSGGVDTGATPAEAKRLVDDSGITPFSPGAWLRIRLPEAGRDGVLPAEERMALSALRKSGWRVCMLVRWDGKSWHDGVRGDGARRLPLDLREAFSRCEALGRAYGGLVDAWEIENEPDISFVEENAETYAAFLKACYLGLKASGAFIGEGANLGAKPRVLMGALAQPPGPYFERLWENGAASYTDGLNFHFYGYAEDVPGVYLQFRDALENAQVSPVAHTAVRPSNAARKELPVFVTEYGYGLLNVGMAETKSGRLRQWRWFQNAETQLRALRPEAAMAFVLRPYREVTQEFGLLRESPPGSENGEKQSLRFEAGDFGLKSDERWIERLRGNSKWGFQVTPALAAMSSGEGAVPSEPMETRAGETTRVVVDFVARTGLEESKRFGGYFVTGFDSENSSKGYGEVVLYNFDSREFSGILFGEGIGDFGSGPTQGLAIKLSAGERRAIPASVLETVRTFSARRASLTFTPNRTGDTADSPATWTSWFYPNPADLVRKTVGAFDHLESATSKRREVALSRSRARDEPALSQAGRWLVSRGVEIREQEGVWRFVVQKLPDEPSRPAMAELPLPEDFAFGRDELLVFSHRVAMDAVSAEGGVKHAAGPASFDVYFRADNGNLYHVWPRLQPLGEWQRFAEGRENFGMAFFGRAHLPWRFGDNKLAALVFFFRPTDLPVAFEIRDAALVKWVVPSSR